MKMRIRSSVNARVQIAILGYATGSDKAALGPGGFRAVKAATLLDSTRGIGGPLPTKGVYRQAQGAGRHGIPSHGVRAVWLSVQTLGASDGVAGGRRIDGHVDTSSDASVKKGRWSTSLVIAAVDEYGGFEWTMKEGRLKAARIAVVGWISDTQPTDAVATTPGGIVPLNARKLTARKTGQSHGGVEMMTAQAVGGEVPANISTVFLFAWIEAKTKAKRVKVSTIVLPAPISPDGQVMFSVMKGAKVRCLSVIGYLAADGAAAADDGVTNPTVTIDPVNNGAPVTLKSGSKVRLTGTFVAQSSGTRSVVVSIGSTVLGSARLDTTSLPRRWSLVTTLPSGNPMLTVTLTSNAGRVATAQTPASVLLV